MYVLGIETSCDETAASVVKDGREILSNVVSSSLRFHKKYGGIVPEIASRMQLETITEVAEEAIKEAGINLKDIDLVSVTSGPGLLGSLLVGISFAKAAVFSLGIPFLGVNHIYSHIYANFLEPQKRKISAKDAKNFCGLAAFSRQSFEVKRDPVPARSVSAVLPFVGLVVSGGHTSLFYIKDFNKIEILGQTQDDACGEAFDKVAKILGLGYPGGPFIEKMAEEGDAKKIKFRCSGTKEPLDFSFSGIKTAVLYLVRDRQLTKKEKQDIAASFQETVIDTLIKKSTLACKLKKVNRLVMGGGVVANSRLREKFYRIAKEQRLNCYFPPKELCIDNAAMVAGLGYQLFRKGHRSDLTLSANLD